MQHAAASSRALKAGRVQADDFERPGPVKDHTEIIEPSETAVDVLFYGRASRDRTGAQSSVTTQETKLDSLLARNPEWKDLGRFIDNDVSASKRGVTRPQFERMMKLIADGDLKPHLIVAYDVSRLFRNRRDKIRLEQLIEQGIHIYDMRYRIDTRDKIGRIVFSIMAEMAIDRAQELAEYQRDYHERRREAGLPAKSARGTGYTQIFNDEGKVVRFEVTPQYAKAVQWAVMRLRAGASLHSVTLEWNNPKSPYHIVPRDAKAFKDTTVRAIVCSARIAGCVDKQELDKDSNILFAALVPNTDGTLPAIVTVDDVLALRERFKINGLRRQNGSGVGRPAKYLCSGIPECGECGSRLYGGVTSKRRLAYNCQECRRASRNGCGPSIRLEMFDEFMTGATFERLRSGALTKLLAAAANRTAEIDEIAQQISFEESELQRFAELVSAGESISPERYLAYTGAKETRIQKLRERLALALASSPESIIPTLPTDLVENIERYWDEADLPWKRQLIRLCFERIIVKKTGRKGRRTPAQSLERVVLIPRGAAGVSELPVGDGQLAA